jgi:aryl-alcohol dehydrogenase-like predicted oxidoreductase
MQYAHLGRSGVDVSRLCLGTMNFGAITQEPEAFQIMDDALDAGINFFDTANVYGRFGRGEGRGRTEEIIGRWFAQGGGRREKVVLATKVYGQTGEWPNESKLSAVNIRRACEKSLQRLQTDYIDLYQMHHVDRDSPWDEIWQAMETLVTQGKVVYVGSSNFAGWHIARANEIATRRHFLGLVSEQSLYNLNARTVELEVLPACETYGLGVIPWSPLAGGLLGGIVDKEKQGRRNFPPVSERLERNRDKIEAYEKLCADAGLAPGIVALAWLLTRPAVTAPIIGPRTREQLADVLTVPDVTLDDGLLAKLDEIFPGPGGPAPEAYAW